ncbi:MAG: hypothetical protein ACR2P0_10590 [Acidimicrobiales bacterium]
MAGFVIFLLVFVAIAVFATSAAAKRAQRINAAWSDAGRRLGLVHRPTTKFTAKSELSGVISTLHVQVRTITRGGENKSTYTAYEVSYPPAGPDVELSRQYNIGGFLKKLLGGRDVIVGDPAFDSKVIVNGPDDASISEFLTLGRRLAVLSLMEEYINVEVSNRRLQVETRNAETDPEALVRNVIRLVDTALVMCTPELVDHALELQEQGEMAAATAELHALNVDATNSFTQLLEAKSLVAMGEPIEAREVLSHVEERLPSDPDVAKWQQVATEAAAPTRPILAPEVAPAPTPQTETTAGATAVVPVPERVDLEQNAVVADLFASNRMGFEVEKLFETVYLGAHVTWTGEIDTMREYRMDSDFDGHGTKTKILIGNLGNSRLVSSQVHAVVQLPPDLTVSRGDTITFRGTLMRVDRFMRNVFVANATIS